MYPAERRPRLFLRQALRRPRLGLWSDLECNGGLKILSGLPQCRSEPTVPFLLGADSMLLRGSKKQKMTSDLKDCADSRTLTQKFSNCVDAAMLLRARVPLKANQAAVR